MQPAVFLDRDNTLIHNDGDLADPDKVRLIQGVATAVASLRGLGFKIVVITNQGGVARGEFTEEDVIATNERVAELITQASNGARIDASYYCPFHPKGKVAKYKKEHRTRKPKPGMILQAAEELGLDLERSWTVGDQVRDAQAGAAAGTRTILLREDADRLQPIDKDDLGSATDEAPQSPRVPNYYARSLVEAVRIIAQQRNKTEVEPTQTPAVPQRKWDAAAVAKLQQARPKPAAEPQPQPEAKPKVEPKPAPTFRPWNAPPPRPEVIETGAEDESQSTSEVPQPSAPPRLAPEGSQKLLKQILQELRNQRGSGEGDYNALTITAIVLQMVVGICLLGGLWMGADSFDMFLRWILVGLTLQGAAVLLLLLGRTS